MESSDALKTHLLEFVRIRFGNVECIQVLGWRIVHWFSWECFVLFELNWFVKCVRWFWIVSFYNPSELKIRNADFVFLNDTCSHATCAFSEKNIVFVPGYRKEVRFFAYVRVGNDLCVYLEKLLENWRFSNFNKSTKHRNMERAFRKLSLNKLENFYRYQSSSKHNIPDSRIESFQFALVSMMNHNSWFVHLKLILKTKIRMLYFNKTIWEVSKRYNMTRARDEFVTFPQRTSKVCFCISQFHTQLKFQNKGTIEAQFMFTLMQLN